ncbi:Ff.00g132010.m01.CDS01 [Fusarium sp. VM40]|nr:Ff.00g132010.m01.CDS01 [Fusarium sp. VM40]
MSPNIRRVAVIGAGPAGAIATDALVKEGAFDTVRVFDRRPMVGGAWVYTPHLPPGIPSLEKLVVGEAAAAVPVPEHLPAVTPVSERVNSHQYRFSDTPTHENIHSNITPELMSYTQEPFPNKLSSQALAEYGPNAPVRHHSTIRDWIEAIFVRGGHGKLLELSTTVERVVKENHEWIVALRKVIDGRNYWWQETFDTVVVASGHYNVPWFPVVEGFLGFDSKFPLAILHSKHFRGGAKFAGKRVIVVGASVSSVEIIYEILDLVKNPLYASVREEPIEAYGWVPFEHPQISVKPAIQRLDPETGRIHLADGSYLDNIDHIIYGTGYTFSVPFLPKVQDRIKAGYRRLPGVFQHTWDIEDPTLTFVGMIGLFTFRAYEWQAVAVARFLTSRSKPLPSVSRQLEWEQHRVREKRGGKAYYSIGSECQHFFEYLRDFAGEPERGTAGRRLPPFDPQWLVIWREMGAPKLWCWRRKINEARWRQGLRTNL